MIWEQVDGEWVVNKRYKGVDWSGISWTEEGHVGCPYCMQELGGDNSQDNFMVYGLDEDGLPNGGHCFSCQSTIISVAVALEDEQNKSSLSGKVISSMLSSKSNKGEISNIKQENNVAFGTNNGKLSRDQQKLAEKRLTQEQIDRIHNETSDELKVGFRGLDKDVCKELNVRWKYDERTGKVTEMYVPAYVLENGEFVLTGYQVRKVRDNQGNLVKDFYALGSVSKLNTFFGQVLNHKETLVIVGGQVDCISAIQMLRQGLSRYPSRIPVVVSAMCGESSTADFIRTHHAWVSKFNKVILALDTDSAGQEAVEKAKEVLNPNNTLVATYALKDCNEYLVPKNKKTANDLTSDIFWNATPVKSYGVKGSKELLKGARLRLQQDKIPFPAFLSDLAEGFTDKSLWLGEWVNWISSVSSGKSTVFDAWMVSWALDSPYRQAIMSYEADWKSFGVKIASLATARAVLRIEGKENRLKWIDENEDAILRLLQDENGNDRFEFVDELPTSVEDAKDLINFLVKVKGVKTLWIDPMLDFLSICSNKQEYDSLIMFLDNIRMSEDVTIMASMHTRKNLSSGANGSNGGEIQEEDAYGGREVIAKGTINITAQRNKNAEDWVEKNTMLINVRKSRNDGGTGTQSKLFYRGKANRLYPYSVAEANGFFESDFGKKVEDIDVNDGYGFSLSDVGVKSFDDHTSEDEKTLEEVFNEDGGEELPF